MKKNVLVIAGLAVLSTNAFASKARMDALQQGSASYYINDTRSVFLNPAAINDNKNYILVEAGDHTTGNPNAEGGFFREMGTFSYGLYLGNNGGSELLSHTTSSDAGGGVTNQEFQAQANGVDLFVGGDMGMKWGANFHMSQQKNEIAGFNSSGNPIDANARKNDAMAIGLGVIHGDMEGYAHIGLNDKSVGHHASATDESKITGDMKIGGSYKLNGWSLFADYSAAKLEEATTTKSNEIVVGAGRSHELSAGTRLFTDVSYSIHTVETTAKTVTSQLPVTLGVETDATSWLSLRASVHQAITGNIKFGTQNDKKVVPETGAVAAGATLNFGKLKIDGTLTNASGNGRLGTNDTISNMAVSYNF